MTVAPARGVAGKAGDLVGIEADDRRDSPDRPIRRRPGQPAVAGVLDAVAGERRAAIARRRPPRQTDPPLERRGIDAVRRTAYGWLALLSFMPGILSRPGSFMRRPLDLAPVVDKDNID